MKKSGSFWISLVSGSFIIFSLYWIVTAVAAESLLPSPDMKLQGLTAVASGGGVNTLFPFYLIAFAFLTAFSGIMALFRRKWARKLIMVLCLAGLINMALVISGTCRIIDTEKKNMIDGMDVRPERVSQTGNAGPFQDSLDRMTRGIAGVVAKTMMDYLFSVLAVRIVHNLAAVWYGIAVFYLFFVLLVFK